MKYLLFLLSTFAVAFGCSSQARQAESASDADSAVVADVADSEYTDISKLRITPIGRYRSYYTMFYRVSGATTTGNIAYTLTMKDSVANCDESSFCYTMANLHGPNSSYGNRYEVYKRMQKDGVECLLKMVSLILAMSCQQVSLQKWNSPQISLPLH